MIIRCYDQNNEKNNEKKVMSPKDMTFFIRNLKL